jgi:DNA-binding transcriptional MerR regulator
MTTPTAYPRKLFYRIQEVANIVGVEPYVLRYWETKFPMLAPEKDSTEQRRYRQKEIDLLLRIRDLLYVEKYTIAGAVDKLKSEGGGRGGRSAAAAKLVPPDRESLDSDLFEGMGSGGADTAFAPGSENLTEEQADALRRVREELGLLKRELEDWRDELGDGGRERA